MKFREDSRIPERDLIKVTSKCMLLYKACIAFVTLYDINGKEYASWKKALKYKSKSRKYYPAFSVSPGAAAVFGLHDASHRGGTYSY